MRKTKRDKTNIPNTIRNWGSGDYKSPLLNRISQLMPVIIVSQLWKERNQHIFHSQPSRPYDIWDKITTRIWETIQIQTWTQEDIPNAPPESNIFITWNTITQKTPLLLSDPPAPPARCSTFWSRSPPCFLNLNFDGATKGNPRPTCFGAVIRYITVQIKHLREGFMGYDTNNSSELWGLIKGLQLSLDLNLQPLIIEGDSKVIISLATKII
jgi:hypothetical protein